MIGGAQPKILLSQAENGNLELSKAFEEVFGIEYINYKLVRERDGLVIQSEDIRWLEFDEDGKCKATFKEIAVGRSLIMSPFNQFFAWQTTLVTEIIEQKEDYIKFATENSIYELWKIKND
jgi:hypothetical protein